MDCFVNTDNWYYIFSKSTMTRYAKNLVAIAPLGYAYDPDAECRMIQ